MLRRVQKYIRDNALSPAGARVLVCVSGGADSVALLDVLLRSGYDCHVAHCNFHLRGPESDRDEQFVRTLAADMAARYGPPLPLSVEHFRTADYAAEHNLSLEMAARELRYRWFAAEAEAHGCSVIAVAHHQNDQAETVLLRLMRGSGLQGLCGMRPQAPNPVVPDSTIPIIRPLLCTTRDYIEHYLSDIRHLSWVTDSTNADPDIPRNAVRQWLTRCPKATIEHISETASHMLGYTALVQEYVRQQQQQLVHQDGQTIRIDLRRLMDCAAPETLLYELLRPYGFRTVDEIFAAAQRGEGGKHFHTNGVSATLKKHQLCVTLE